MTTRKRADGEGSIFPYRTGFAAYVRVTRLDGSKAKKWVYGKTREETHEKWLELHRKAKDGPVATKVPTVASFMAYWLEEVIKTHSAPKTYDNYERFNRLYITPGLGKKKLDKLQLREAQTWINKIAVTCQCCSQGKDAAQPEQKRQCCAKSTPKCCMSLLSHRTIADIRNCLRSALSQAQAEELVTRNIAGLIKVTASRSRKGQAWTTEEARQFLESARADNDPMYATYVLILILGLRKGEVLGLEESDVDLEAATLVPGLQLQRVGRQLLHRQTKTEASDQGLPLPPICVTALRRRFAEKHGARLAAGDKWRGSALIITTRFGTPIEPRNLNRSWDKRCRKAGVRKITVHDARRTCASLLVDLDVHPRVIMQILRHADFKVTMEIYSKVTSKQTREALKRLSESFD